MQLFSSLAMQLFQNIKQECKMQGFYGTAKKTEARDFHHIKNDVSKIFFFLHFGNH